MQSFENLEHWRTDFLHNASPPDPDNFPFLVLGNKCDLEAERKVPKQKALQWAKSKGPNVSDCWLGWAGMGWAGLAGWVFVVVVVSHALSYRIARLSSS